MLIAKMEGRKVAHNDNFGPFTALTGDTNLQNYYHSELSLRYTKSKEEILIYRKPDCKLFQLLRISEKLNS